METIRMSWLTVSDRVELLRGLGYDSDGTVVLRDGQPHHDPCTGEVVLVARMMVLPGSAIVLDENEASLAWYVANCVE